MADKVKSVADVVRTIPDGSHIALGGFAINRCNIVIAHELIRQRKKNLTLSQGVVGLDTDLLVVPVFDGEALHEAFPAVDAATCGEIARASAAG